MLDAGWVGRRVTIRHARDADDTGLAQFTDSVGDLVALTTDTAVVETRRGRTRVPLARVVAARVAEPSVADVLALEAICARGWRAEQNDRRGGWLLRANRGFTGRANTALPLHQPETSLTDTLDAARAWYAERSLPLRVHVPLPARHLLDAELTERGWTADPDVYVLAARIDMLDTGATSGVEIAAAPDAAWMARFRDGKTPPVAREILIRHPRAGFAELRRDGRTIAIGRGVVDDGWLGVTAVEVDPDWRRRGLATAIMQALWRWGTETHDATRSYLQVTVDNHAALRLYERLGYWRHHTYRYRSEPSLDGTVP